MSLVRAGKSTKMDVRTRKISIRKASGNASSTSRKYSIDLPSVWMNELNISEDDREVNIVFDGKTITINRDLY